MSEKIAWQGQVLAIQPRIRLTRSFDQYSHTYLGFVLRLEGIVEGEERSFLVGIGKAAQAKYKFPAGDTLGGESPRVVDHRKEAVEFYKTSKRKVHQRSGGEACESAPWPGPAQDLVTYRRRGHRRLDAKTYSVRCWRCHWGCRMAVEMIIDQWNPQKRPLTEVGMSKGRAGSSALPSWCAQRCSTRDGW